MPDQTPPRLPVPLATSARTSARTPSAADPAYAAQALGQGGQKRGLKGGAPVLNAARQSYLHAQWSGPGDRRMPAGVIRRDKI